MGWKMRFTYDKHQHPTLNANNQEGDVRRHAPPSYNDPFSMWRQSFWLGNRYSAQG